MVLSLAAAYGEDLSLERARELLGVLAAGFGLRALSPPGREARARRGLGRLRGHRLRGHRGDGPVHHAVLRARRAEGRRRGDGGDPAPRRRGGEDLRLPPATPVVAVAGPAVDIIAGMFSLLRRVSSETRSGLSTLRKLRAQGLSRPDGGAGGARRRPGGDGRAPQAPAGAQRGVPLGGPARGRAGVRRGPAEALPLRGRLYEAMLEEIERAEKEDLRRHVYLEGRRGRDAASWRRWPARPARG